MTKRAFCVAAVPELRGMEKGDGGEPFPHWPSDVGDDLDEEFGKAIDDLLAPVIVHFPLDDTQGKPADDPVGDDL